MKILKNCAALVLFVPLAVAAPPEYFVPLDWFPCTGRYVSAPDVPLVFFGGFVVRNLVVRDLPLVGPPPVLGFSQVYSFSPTNDLDFSADAGATFQRFHAVGSSTANLVHYADTGAVRYFSSDMWQHGFTFSSTIMVRESPTRSSSGMHTISPSGGGYMISSFFDVFLELSVDGGQTWMPSLDSLRLTMYYPPEFTSPSDLYFPPTGGFAARSQGCDARFANGVGIRAFTHDQPTQAFPPPLPGPPQFNSFGGRAMFELSFDGGLTWVSVVAATTDYVRVAATLTNGNTRCFDTELLALNFVSGLPPAVMLRESPTRASTGKLNILYEAGPALYDISSFFDVFLEVSLDGGLTWWPAVDGPFNLELGIPMFSVTPGSLAFGSVGLGDLLRDSVRIANTGSAPLIITSMVPSDPVNFTALETFPLVVAPGESAWAHAAFHPTTAGFHAGNFSFVHNGLTSPDTIHVDGTGSFEPATGVPRYIVPHDQFLSNGKYMAPQGSVVAFSNGVRLRNIVTRELPLVGSLPALGTNVTFGYNTMCDLDLSTDGGLTYQRQHFVLFENVYLSHVADIDATAYYLMEMQSFSAAGIGGVLIMRESPTRRSPGQHAVHPVSDGGYSIDSFFDIYLEVSVDGGATWTPAPDSLRLTMYYPPEYQVAVPLYFPLAGRYVSTNAVLDGTYPMGIMLRHIIHDQPSAGYPLPPPLGTQVNTFNGRVTCEASMDGGITWVPVTAPSFESVRVTDVGGSGAARVYDTEMLGLNISGGTLPPGIMIRESPTIASTGKLANRTVIGGPYYRMSSFFDIFTEVSVDGGLTWWTQVDGPIYLEMDGQTEIDTFSGSRARLVIRPPSGLPETVELSGETVVRVHIPPEGTAADNDADSLDQVETEMVSMDLTGTSSLGPVVLRLDDRHPTMGEIEETVNATPGILDLSPWGDFPAESFFDIVFRVDVGGMPMYSGIPVRVDATITHKPPAPGESYRYAGQGVPLVDSNWVQTGVLVDSVIWIPRPIAEAVIDVDLDGGWNLISNPVLVSDDTLLHLFPTSLFAHGYYFGATGYEKDTTLENGCAYWGKFPQPITQTLRGGPIVQDTIPVVGGWNMVGSISVAVDTGLITSIPADLKRSAWYGYGTAGYQPATQIVPGEGYWVKAAGPGAFVIANVPGARVGSIRESVSLSANGLSSLIITDGRGRSQTVYFGRAGKVPVPVSMFDLPPLPPAGAFDARIETPDGGSMVKIDDGDGPAAAGFTVAVQSEANPLTVAWNLTGGESPYELTDENGGSELRTVMVGSGSVTIPRSGVHRFLVKPGESDPLPVRYALAQNYPNPFNPRTTIRYDLPRDSRVDLIVFDLLGRKVATLVQEEQKAGYRSVEWNAAAVSSGMYFYRIVAGTFCQVRKLTVLK